MDLNIQDVNGKTLLHWACKYKKLDVVKALLQSLNNVDPNIKDIDGRTPLHCECQCRNDVVVKLLLRFPKVNPNIQDITGNTPLHWALLQQSSNMDPTIQDVDGRTSNVLSQTFYHQIDKQEELVKTLLLHPQINIHLSNKDGFRPIQIARMIENHSIIKLLEYAFYCS
jgi:ankyrin repeat protein